MSITQQSGTTAGEGFRRRRGWLGPYGCAALLALAVGGATPSGGPLPADAAPGAPAALAPSEPAVAPARVASPLDEPLRLIGLARASYAQVQDYTCLLVKHEHLEGQPAADSVMTMMVRTQPFSVYLRWLQPRALAGQEVCYVAGRNDGMMRVRPKGLLGVVGFVSLDPNDPRARQSSRHSITEAGLGNLIERFAHHWEAERGQNLTQVRIADYEYNRRHCTRVETIHPTNPQGQFLHHRSVVYFDQETHLPIRIECYAWPRHPGDPGQLQEVFSYANLRLNVHLGDEVFDH